MTGALVPVEREAPDFGQLVEAFIARDYVAAARLADDYVHQAGPIQGVQLSLLSLSRSGRPQEAKRLARIVADRVGEVDPWSSDLVRLAVGERAVADVLSDDLNAVERCQARFYAGAALATSGRMADAVELFDDCLAGGAACLEVYLAEVERANLSSRDR